MSVENGNKDAEIPKENAENEKTALTMADEVNNSHSAAVMDDGPELDQSKVKFINGVDASVDLGKKVDDTAFVGLTKNELMKYATDPYWVRLRMVLLVLFWVGWFAMLAAAIIIIVVAPKCPPRPDLDWWQKSTVYKVVPKSFQDTNGDGVGDLTGIQKHVNYLKDDLNVSAVRLSPFYPAYTDTLGNMGIADLKAIDTQVGDMDDFSGLVSEMHRKGIKLIIDLELNHVSDKHHWFNESRKDININNKYHDFFIWSDKGQLSPEHWTKDATIDRSYYHTFSKSQPDLNFRNRDVVEEIKGVFTFWLGKKVDGFHILNAKHLVDSNSTDYVNQIQPETYTLIAEFRKVIVDFKPEDACSLLSVDAADSDITNGSLSFYGSAKQPGANTVVYHSFDDVKKDCNGTCIYNRVHERVPIMTTHTWSSEVMSDDTVSRIGTRVGSDMVNAFNMLQLTLPGTPVTYYGQEIGMLDSDNKTGKEHLNAMQWSGEAFAGFSKKAGPIPVSVDFKTRNVRLQLAHGSKDTNIEVFQSLTLLRQQPSFQWGLLQDVYHDQNIYSFVRQAKGFEGYLIAINFGSTVATPNFHTERPTVVPSEGEIVAHTKNFKNNEDEFAIGTKIQFDHIYLQKGQGVIFKWNANAIEHAES